jgi:hypothetical protein
VYPQSINPNNQSPLSSEAAGAFLFNPDARFRSIGKWAIFLGTAKMVDYFKDRIVFITECSPQYRDTQAFLQLLTVVLRKFVLQD